MSRKAQQYHRAAELVKSFNEKGIPTELLVEVREIERRDLSQRSADQAMAADLRKLVDQLPSATRKSWKEPVAEVLEAIDQAPESVRDRLAAWRKARSQTAATTSQSLFSLAMSGFVAGHDLAAPELKAAEMLWKARELVRDYLGAGDQGLRAERLAQLDELDWGAVAASADHGPPARCADADRPAHASALARRRNRGREDPASSRAGARERRADRVCRAPAARIPSAPQLPRDRRPPFGRRAQQGARPVGGRGGSPGVYPDRSGVFRAGKAGGVSLHDQRTRRRRAGAARRPQALCDRQRPGLRRRSARWGQHGLGLCRWPIPTSLPAWS